MITGVTLPVRKKRQKFLHCQGHFLGLRLSLLDNTFKRFAHHKKCDLLLSQICDPNIILHFRFFATKLIFLIFLKTFGSMQMVRLDENSNKKYIY
jgi:hypothetical protein